MFGNLGTSELLILGVIILFLFGSKKLNELARGLGESTKEARKLKREFEKALHDNPLDEKTVDKDEKEE